MADRTAISDPPRLPYEARPSVETLATLGEDEAVRRRSDARNFRVLRWCFRVFLVASVIELGSGTFGSSADSLGAWTAVASTAFALLVLLVMRRIDPRGGEKFVPDFVDPLARRVVASFRASALIAFAVEAALFVAFSAHAGSPQSWLVILPFVVMALRLLPSEALLLHGLLIALAFAASLVPSKAPLPTRTGKYAVRSQSVVPALACNAIALAIGLAGTRRYTRSAREEWRALREGARDQIRMRDELDFARKVQLSMLPGKSPAVEWLDIAARSLPATEVGGDYFDYFPLGTDRLGIVSADVAGHGLASGLILSGLRSCLALLSDELGEPGAVLRRLDRMVRRTTSHRMLVTLVIALFDRSGSNVTITSAGHPPVLKRSKAGGRAEPVAFSSLPLGTKIESEFDQRRLPFAAGDVFLLYTDGLYEATDASGEPYGLERLRAGLERLPVDRSAEAICDALLADLAAFTGRAANPDDVTLVAVRVL